MTCAMTHSFRAALRVVAVTTFAVMIAVSAWLLVSPPRGRAADCATAHAMWTYYESQLASVRSAAQESNADNSQTEAAYRNMVNELQTYANRITTPDIRTKADTVVAIDREHVRTVEALGGRKPVGIIGLGSPNQLRQAIRQTIRAKCKKTQSRPCRLRNGVPKLALIIVVGTKAGVVMGVRQARWWEVQLRLHRLHGVGKARVNEGEVTALAL